MMSWNTNDCCHSYFDRHKITYVPYVNMIIIPEEYLVTISSPTKFVTRPSSPEVFETSAGLNMTLGMQFSTGTSVMSCSFRALACRSEADLDRSHGFPLHTHIYFNQTIGPERTQKRQTDRKIQKNIQRKETQKKLRSTRTVYIRG